MPSKKKPAPPPSVTAEPTPPAEPLQAEVQKRVAAKVAVPVVPQAIVRPRIVSGKCEFDGQHYTECEHYAGMEVFCSYCGSGQDVLDQREVHVYSLPQRPHEYIFVCSDFKCTDAHRKKFTTNPNY